MLTWNEPTNMSFIPDMNNKCFSVPHLLLSTFNVIRYDTICAWWNPIHNAKGLVCNHVDR
jgi:hypothetical protein